MFEGGISFNIDSDKAVRYIALLGTPIFVGYNLLVYFGIAQSSNYAGGFVSLLISALWLLVGIYHFFAPIRSRIDMLVRLVLYHGLALATVLFITGFLEPFASSIALLFLASNIYFGRKALAISVGSVIVAATVDSIVRYPNDPSIVINNFLGASAIIVLGLAMVGIIIAQETRRQTLIQSQASERLQYERILTIINNLSDATFSTDDKGNILMYNAACLDLLDTNENLKGVNITSLFQLTDKDKVSVKLFDILRLATKTVRRDDLRHTYSDGEDIRLEMTYAPIKSVYSRRKKGQVQAGFILIVRDVTKQKSLEEERDEFISVVSHELRTPITIVEGTLSNLKFMMDMPKKPDDFLLKGSITTAHDQVLYLAKMVNDLSTLSRAERGVADVGEDIPVEELMHKLHNQYEKDARARHLHLDLDLGTRLGKIHVSRLYVEELLQNFITNAIKYTNEGSITISAKTKAGIIHFAVKDSGIGISRSDQQKIFAKFYRSEDYRIRETNGTGLGLYVSAKLAHKIGTQIAVSSRLNHGSTFSFDLPQVTT
ncbi:MAG: PAS domain-containing protein [Candidatus Microsaccharimonas sossegonensis]|uniref:histidine kinase n=1 Tax=Candidatus Microsaccharimonas sossegonensis TaxID=2506948 RepID=A0A4Q0AJ69_9BACT|nr:MAG: PAS domain-containing protein [Candidatus Microsaccharimonas sossegonensis]